MAAQPESKTTMKTERRHELQQNDLALWLAKVNTAIEPYSKLIAIVVLAIFVLSVVVSFVSTLDQEQRSESTLNLIQATGAQESDELLRVSDRYPGTIAGEWAKLYQGLQYVSQGIEALYTDRENAQELLTDATTVLTDAAGNSDDTLLKSRANLGLAQAAESLGNVDDAIKAYEQVVAINESEAMVKRAEDRIKTLSSPKTQEFLAWFADQNFAAVAPPNLDPSLPPSTGIPGLPDIDLPELNLSSDEDVAPRDLEGGLELPEEGMAPEGNEDSANGEASEVSDPVSDDSAAEGTTPETTTASESAGNDAEAPGSDASSDAGSGESSGDASIGDASTGDGPFQEENTEQASGDQ